MPSDERNGQQGPPHSHDLTREELEILIQRHGCFIRQVALRSVLRTRHEVDELVSRIYQRMLRLDLRRCGTSDAAIKVQICREAKWAFQALNREAKRRTREVQVSDCDLELAGSWSHDHGWLEFNDAMVQSGASPREIEALWLRHQDLTLSEIAGKLDTSIGKVRALLRKGQNKAVVIFEEAE